MQFPPISDTPFYTSNIKPPLTFTKQTQKKVIGKKSMGKLHNAKLNHFETTNATK